MARRTKEEIRIAKATDAAFYKHGTNKQFKIFDLAKITAAGTLAGRAGEDIEAAVIAAIERYETKPTAA